MVSWAQQGAVLAVAVVVAGWQVWRNSGGVTGLQRRRDDQVRLIRLLCAKHLDFAQHEVLEAQDVHGRSRLLVVSTATRPPTVAAELQAVSMQELKRQVGARGRGRAQRRSKPPKRQSGRAPAPSLPELDVRYRLRLHDDSLAGLEETLAAAEVLDYEQEARVLANARQRQREGAEQPRQDGAGTDSGPKAGGDVQREKDRTRAFDREDRAVEAPVGADGTVGEPVPV